MEQVKRFQRQINTKICVPNGFEIGNGLEDRMHHIFSMNEFFYLIMPQSKDSLMLVF